MDTFQTIGQSNELSESQKRALISLLADEDIHVFKTIREKLISYGTTAIEWLKPYLADPDPVLRRRTRDIYLFLQRKESDNRFLEYCLHNGENINAEMGAFLLAQTVYPDINIVAYQAILDSYANEIKERIQGGASPAFILTIMNDFLFTELGFSGNEIEYYDPDNNYLNKVIDRRMGNPVSLCLLYLFISWRLLLPVVGISMPGHFLCRFQNAKGETFIDAFNKGRLLSKSECIKYLVQSGHGYMEGYLSPSSPRRMLLRLCANLHQIYSEMEQLDEVHRIQRYIVALSK